MPFRGRTQVKVAHRPIKKPTLKFPNGPRVFSLLAYKTRTRTYSDMSQKHHKAVPRACLFLPCLRSRFPSLPSTSASPHSHQNKISAGLRGEVGENKSSLVGVLYPRGVYTTRRMHRANACLKIKTKIYIYIFFFFFKKKKGLQVPCRPGVRGRG